MSEAPDGLNMAWEAVDRQASRHPQRVALRCLQPHAPVVDVTYGELAARSDRFASVLAGLGVGAGDRVATALPAGQDFTVAVLGTLKRRASICSLFAAYGPEPLADRMRLAANKVLVTTAGLYRSRIAPMREGLPALDHVLLTDGDPDATALALPALMKAAGADCRTEATDPGSEAVLHFTSGTTGTPKGVIHAHEAIVAQRESARTALDLSAATVYWCTADPGWITGLVYGVLAPLSAGATVVIDSEAFDPGRWLDTLARQAVEVWYTSPTALRLLMSATGSLAPEPQRYALRRIACVGEPLDPDIVGWSREFFGVPVRDTWWQTETGAILIANHADPVEPGPLGVALPGIEASVVARKPDETIDHVARGETGELAIRTPWPSMFRGYLNDPERYRRCFRDGWYLTGDLVRQDDQGRFWFVARDDDLIKTAGHLLSPVEIENAVRRHPGVRDVGVTGLADKRVGQRVEAFVVAADPAAAGPELAAAILAFARKRLGSSMAPRAIRFVTELPRTHSGKLARRRLAPDPSDTH